MSEKIKLKEIIDSHYPNYTMLASLVFLALMIRFIFNDTRYDD